MRAAQDLDDELEEILGEAVRLTAVGGVERER